jgi:hypothetical protein
MSRRPRLEYVISAALLAATASIAQQSTQPVTPSGVNSWAYGGDVGFGHSDNISLVPSDKISENMAIADFNFALNQSGSRLEDSLKGNFSWFDFLEHTYGNELIGRFDGAATLGIVPERVTWTLQDEFGQGQVDAFGAPTPNNIQNINYFSTGPNLTFRFAGTTFLDVTARYGRVQFGASPFDSDRLLGGIELGEDLSARSTVGLNVNSERVLFTNTAQNTDFDRSSAFLDYHLHGARTDVNLRAGLTHENAADFSTSGPLGLIDVTRKTSPASSLEFSAGRDLTDASASFANLQNGALNTINFAQAAITSDVYTISFAQAAWRYSRDRTGVTLSGRWERDSYGDQLLEGVNLIGNSLAPDLTNAATLDHSRRGVELSINEQLTRTFSVQVLGSYYDTSYQHANFLSDSSATNYGDARAGAGLTWREGRALVIQLRYDHIARIVSGVGSGTGYQENTVFLTFGYQPLTASPGAGAPAAGQSQAR